MKARSAETACQHPARRLYSWRALDGTLCVACCDCGAVLAGAAPSTGEAAS
jgi:hypothetical protein